MKKNVGSTDKVIRLLAAALFAILYLSGTISGTLGIVLLILAGTFTLTSFISFCPIYSLIGVSTCKKPAAS